MAATAREVALVGIEERDYQASIAQACAGRNSLIVLPTGLGKTLICARVMKRHLEAGQRVLVIAPTRPLVEQHAGTFRDHLEGVEVTTVTGRTSPADRPAAWQEAPVVVATPQVARNDLVTGKLEPEPWGLLVVDEAHRAVGNYAATEVAQDMLPHGIRVLAATASPGATPERIQEVCENLHIEHVEARGPWDEDVRPYVERVRTDWIRVALPNTLEQAATCLRKLAEAEVAQLRSRGLYASRFVSRRELLKVQKTLAKRRQGNADKATSKALSHVGQALKALHGAQLIQTQSVSAARDYVDQLQQEPRFEQPSHLKDADRLLNRYMGEHPKMRRCASELRQYLEAHPDGRAIVFTQFRKTAAKLTEALEAVTGVDPGLFVGQSGRDRLSQGDQVALLDRFRQGDPNVLVATSVGEEGLDVPQVGLVIFYEPVASPVRAVQRRGRTGRDQEGRVLLLMAQGTSDEATYWKAASRERQMRQLVKGLQEDRKRKQGTLIRPNPAPPTPETEDGPQVIVDHRELNGPLARLLRQRGLDIRAETLPVGDVILSNRVVIERKSAEDLTRSLMDGRLMDQARTLKRNFEAPIIVVEGDPFEQAGNIRREAIAGTIATLGARFGITVLTVKDPIQAADVVAAMAKKEQDDGQGPPKLRYGTAGRTQAEQQRYLIEGLPQVSSTLAERLLDHFETPAQVLTATEDELRKVHGIGPVTASAIHEVLHARFEAPWHAANSSEPPAPAPTTASGTGNGKSAS
ncbi:MAG: ERCC4 domain-containing protein [Candidatus Thermoplasmatota archaeon]|nr:ERCC4 domain-containing protein [Candidatus Thermoplasmatota archaeon]